MLVMCYKMLHCGRKISWNCFSGKTERDEWNWLWEAFAPEATSCTSTDWWLKALSAKQDYIVSWAIPWSCWRRWWRDQTRLAATDCQTTKSPIAGSHLSDAADECRMTMSMTTTYAQTNNPIKTNQLQHTSSQSASQPHPLLSYTNVLNFYCN